MVDWTPQPFPFNDPAHPDFGVETELWKGGPRPQHEVAGEPANDSGVTINGVSYRLSGPISSYPSPISPPYVLAGNYRKAFCPACKGEQDWDYDILLLAWRCVTCGIVDDSNGPQLQTASPPELKPLVKQVDDEIDRLMTPRVTAYDDVAGLHINAAMNSIRSSRWYQGLLKEKIDEEWLTGNWSAAEPTNFIMDFSPRNYVMSAAPIYRLPISLPIMQQFRSWLVGRLDSLAAWLQP